jgi:DNA-binding MarR family transcriptional regulator
MQLDVQSNDDCICNNPGVADEVPEQHLRAWRALLNVHAATVARVEAALARQGLPPLGWYDVLWALYRAPDRRLRMSEVADSLTISRSTFTRLAARIEAAGLLRRERHPSDGRGQLAVLTPAGEEMLRRMWPVYARELNAAVTASLPARDAARLAALLERLRGEAAPSEDIATVG